MMARSDQLELREHRGFQERFWTVQRWAWVGYGVIIGAALLGVTGEGGLFARARMETGNNTIDHPRFARWQTQDSISIAFAPSGATERRVLLSPEFVRGLAVETMQPQPARSTASAAGEELTILVRSNEPGTATLRIKPNAPGIVRGAVSIDGAPAAVTIIILP
jgi:hypothetical protein